jgi:hypothetical protein
MRHKRQGPTWWNAWLPLLLPGGLIGLESQLPLTPGGHQIAQLMLVLLMYGLVMGWLRRNRGALINEAYEREQPQYTYEIQQQQLEPVMGSHEPWDDTWQPWQNPGHDMDIQRRR